MYMIVKVFKEDGTHMAYSQGFDARKLKVSSLGVWLVVPKG